MFETNEQKKYLITIILLVVILSAVSLWNRPRFGFVNQTNNTQNSSSGQQFDVQAYQKYLDSLQIDKQASNQLFQQILTPQDVRREMEAALQASQPITLPVIDEKTIAVSKQTGQKPLENYLAKVAQTVSDFNNQASAASQGLFSGDANSSQQLLEIYDPLFNKLKAVPVPKDATAMQKALLTAYLAYGDLLQTSKTYADQPSMEPWPKVYNSYAVINDQLQNFNGQLNSMAAKYHISSISLDKDYAQEVAPPNLFFIPTAHAFLPGVATPVFTIGDIPRIIRQALEDGLAAAFAQFLGSFINQTLQKIESNYAISNFLYYTDALVNGQYADDYLNKYVSDVMDRNIIKGFIPQFNCGQQNPNLKAVMEAQAKNHLGFDANALDPNDPNFYQKLAKVGDFLSSANGWQLTYQDLAAQAQSAAQQSAQQELTSPGLKTPRDTTNRAITLSINGIIGTEHANLNNLMNLGIGTVTHFISGMVSRLIQSVMTNFVFKGVTGSGGAIGVFKEQATCLAAAQIQPVIAAASASYSSDPEASAALQCATQASLSDSCTTATMNQLMKCKNNPPADDAGKQYCSSIANSSYINAMLSQCQQDPSTKLGTYTCANLQSLLQYVH